LEKKKKEEISKAEEAKTQKNVKLKKKGTAHY